MSLVFDFERKLLTTGLVRAVWTGEKHFSPEKVD
jgi:hypothetical protein